MRRCCATDCKKKGIHSFPKNSFTSKQWEMAVRRKGFIATKNSRLCSDHFTDDDYQKEGFYSGLKVLRKTLKKGVIPTLFAWSKEESVTDEWMEKSVEKHIKTELDDGEDTSAKLKACSSSVAVAVDINCSKEVEMADVAIKVEVTASSSTSHDLPGIKTTSSREVGSQKNYQFFSIDNLRENSKAIKFYTGLESYEKFYLIFSTLRPEVHSLKYRWSQVLLLSTEDQFLLTLIKLRRNKVDFELSFLFDISQTAVANIFVAWINFIHKMWSSREGYLEYFITEEFGMEDNSNINSITSIEDDTEVSEQQDLLSPFKTELTDNLTIGATPNDTSSQCSETHDVSTSDSFDIQSLPNISTKEAKVNIRAFRQVKRQTKALFSFLQEPCKKYLNYMTKIDYICQRLYNFNEGIVP